jgi:putative membrane protein
MKRWTQTVLGVSLAASVVACSGENRGSTADNPAAGREPGAAVGTTGAAADRDFIEDQLEGGQAEVNLGRIAEERATNPQVKEFAQRMVKDHQMAAEELRQAASAANVQVNPPAEAEGEHKEVQEELSKLSGAEFDRTYMEKMVEKHEKTVNVLEKKADTGNPQVRQWVTKVLPTVREHLAQAKQIHESLERAGTTQ